MKHYHKNPRRITDDDLDDLRRWLEELGDLSGIVHDLESDEIIGGNQRGRVFDINSAAIELVEGPHEPDEQVTQHTRPGELCYEPFSGSGTQIVAGENLGRQVRAVEIAPQFVAVCLDRYWRAFEIRGELVEG